MSVSHRKNRVPIRISGADAEKLLHDVLTATIIADANEVRWWALLSAQGKIQVEGLIGWADEAFWLDVAADAADSFLKRMRMYKLRANAVIEDMRESYKVGWSSAAGHDFVAHKDPRGDALGFRIIAENDATATWETATPEYTAARVSLGIVEVGTDFDADSLFPHDIGMDFLAGVDFSKGCYVGQEIVSRMQHRGTARRRPVILHDLAANAGTTLESGGKNVGAIGAPIGGAAVGIVRIDRVKNGAVVSADGVPVTLALPSWAGYDFSDSTDTSDENPTE